MSFTSIQAQQIITNSTVLYTAAEIDTKIKSIAAAIELELNSMTEIPIFLIVMNGGMFFGAKLLSYLKNPFICDYIHASRYGDEQFGSSHISWFRQPKTEEVKGKIVYVIDDLLDEGYTLLEVKRFLESAGSKSCKIVALIDKDINKPKPIKLDHYGFIAPNKFLFGFGMDIQGIYRQEPNIYIYNG